MSHNSKYILITKFEESKAIQLDKEFQVYNVKVYINGIRRFLAVDYSFDGTTVIINSALVPDDTLIIDYVLGH